MSLRTVIHIDSINHYYKEGIVDEICSQQVAQRRIDETHTWVFVPQMECRLRCRKLSG